MTPVDGIQAPRTKRPSSARTVRPVRKKSKIAAGTELPQTPRSTTLPIPEPVPQTKKRERMVWMLAIGITGAIFILWVLLMSNGSLNSEANDSSFWGRVSTRLSSFIETVQTDWLHLKDTIETNNSNAPAVDEERIRQLEEQVFPQFTDPTKQ